MSSHFEPESIENILKVLFKHQHIIQYAFSRNLPTIVTALDIAQKLTFLFIFKQKNTVTHRGRKPRMRQSEMDASKLKYPELDLRQGQPESTAESFSCRKITLLADV